MKQGVSTLQKQVILLYTPRAICQTHAIAPNARMVIQQNWVKEKAPHWSVQNAMFHDANPQRVECWSLHVIDGIPKPKRCTQKVKTAIL